MLLLDCSREEFVSYSTDEFTPSAVDRLSHAEALQGSHSRHASLAHLRKQLCCRTIVLFSMIGRIPTEEGEER